jgi:hypothetical protein
MITQPESITKLKQLFTEIFLNKTDKVSDVSDNSVLNATSFGVAKVAQKALKDIAIVEAKLFPDNATGEYLDRAADLYGVSPRRTATGSSTYIRVIADPGTLYLAGINTFVNNNGIVFELSNDFTVPSDGYGYIQVRSIDTGAKTNIDPASIIAVTPVPVGHTAVTNEYISTGGADEESDEVFRQRIKNNLNILSISTLEYFNQLFQNVDNRILRTLNLGTNDQGIRNLAIVTQNGVDLTPSELEALLDETKEFFPITDLNRFGDVIGIELVNVEWYGINYDGVIQTVGIDFRVQIAENADVDIVRKNIQINLSKYLDFRFWQANQVIEWDDLLRIVQDTSGVRYVPDSEFNPNSDEVVPINQLPRVQKFVMRDLDGNIIYDSGGILSPVFYPTD